MTTLSAMATLTLGLTGLEDMLLKDSPTKEQEEVVGNIVVRMRRTVSCIKGGA